MQKKCVSAETKGKPVKDIGEFRNEISSNPPGTKLKLTIFRDGEEIEIDTQTEELPDDIAVAARVPELSEKLGLSVQNLTAENAQKHGYEEDSGVLVTNVEQGSLAWQPVSAKSEGLRRRTRKMIPRASRCQDIIVRIPDFMMR